MHEEGRRYEVREALGKGGFGTVYRAELVGSGGFSKPVALKILNADMEGLEEVAMRLRDEARMLGLLRHRAIVQVDGLVQLDGRWTIVMEFVEGVDLRTLLSLGPVPPGPALEIVQEVAAALHVAYDRPTSAGSVLKLLHRDVKPANIQLTAAGEVKVLDFGIARAEFGTREAETRSLMFGSVPYMAPERLDFVDSHAGDVYALGAVLYELLTGDAIGKTSANENRHRELMDGKLAGMDGVDEPIVGLLRRMLAFEPEARPSAREVEREARALRVRFPEPALGDLAEERVAVLLRDRPLTHEDLSGSVLIEGTTERRAAPSGSPVAAAADDPATRWERVSAPKPPVAPVEPVPVAAAAPVAEPAPPSASPRAPSAPSASPPDPDHAGSGRATLAVVGVLGGIVALATVFAVGFAAFAYWNADPVLPTLPEVDTDGAIAKVEAEDTGIPTAELKTPAHLGGTAPRQRKSTDPVARSPVTTPTTTGGGPTTPKAVMTPTTAGEGPTTAVTASSGGTGGVEASGPPPGEGAARDHTGAVSITSGKFIGALDTSEAQRLVTGQERAFARCFSAPGHLVLKVTVGKTGAVGATNVLEDTTGGATAADCASAAVRGIAFPAIKGGGMAMFHLTLRYTE